MDFPEHLQPRIFDRHEAELTAEERAIAIGAFCRRIIRDPNSGPALTAAAMRCLREVPEPTDAALERLLRALDRPED